MTRCSESRNCHNGQVLQGPVVGAWRLCLSVSFLVICYDLFLHHPSRPEPLGLVRRHHHLLFNHLLILTRKWFKFYASGESLHYPAPVVSRS